MAQTIQEIRDDFAFLDEWEDRYRYVIELGEALPPFPYEFRVDKYKVQGCVSQVWLTSETEATTPPTPPWRGVRRRARWSRRAGGGRSRNSTGWRGGWRGAQLCKIGRAEERGCPTCRFPLGTVGPRDTRTPEVNKDLP